MPPTLGIVRYRRAKSFELADIPGIIEGPHEGRVLGLRLLRHIERNAVLLFMVPSDTENISKEFKILVNELNQYSPELMDKPRLLAISKMDLVPKDQVTSIKRKTPKGVPYCLISAASGQGLDELRDLLWKYIQGPE